MEVNILLFDDFDTMDAFGPVWIVTAAFSRELSVSSWKYREQYAGGEGVDRTAGTGRAAGDCCNTRGTGSKTAVISGYRKPAPFEENGGTI